MITPHGYSKDPSIRPDGIVITWSKELLEARFGREECWEKVLLKWLNDEDDIFIQKQRAAPKYDILYVYVIVDGLLQYRLNYVGWNKGPCEINSRILAKWNYIILTGPAVRNPQVTPMKGFQGFRYCTELF